MSPRAPNRLTRGAGLTAVWRVGALLCCVASLQGAAGAPPAGFVRRFRPHFDHTPITKASYESPQAVTRHCLSCHPKATAVMATSHWTWLGAPAKLPGRAEPLRLGKKNLVNNFCLSARGNETSCMQCHAGYGWDGPDFDFTRVENVDCLVCHERSGAYVKGRAGLPTKTSDLAAAARSVSSPSRESCLTCHAYGGGGQAVKHGDLDGSLVHPSADTDVHMGRHGLVCIDCHGGPNHTIRGHAYSVSVESTNHLSCADCHRGQVHADARVETHLARVACQTCHIPTFARRIPTKMTWDWSQAGDASRADDTHHYLKIKGAFTYERDLNPEYRWFNLTVDRYLAGDRIQPDRVTSLNPPRGGRADPSARIWPFKVHRARQPFDAKHGYLLMPVTAGQGGYWSTFDWEAAFRLAEKSSGLAYSGKHGFAPTEMYWPLSHMVTPKERSLGCTDCHGPGGRLDWAALGYFADPMRARSRP